MNPESTRRVESRWLSYLLYSLLGLAVLAAVLQPLRSYDLWWHLATGRLILEQGGVPTGDPFSFTRQGTPWIDHEWLFQVLALGIFRFGGWRALLGVDLLVVLSAIGCLARVVRREGCPAAMTCFLLLLSLSGARFRFDPRPEVVSLFFLVLLCTVLHRSRAPGERRWIGILPPLFLLWANIHPAVLLGAALLLLWLIGEGVDRLLGRHPASLDPLRLSVALASPLLALANPGGWRLLEVPVNVRRIVTSGHAPNLEWAAPRLQDFPFLYLAALVAGVILLSRFRDLDLAPTLVAVAAGILAFLHLRNTGFFFFLLPLALARPLSRLSERLRIPEIPSQALCASLLGIVSLLFVRGNAVSGEQGYLSAVAPERAVDFIESHRIGRHLFNDVKFGGYLIWRRYPQRQVFIDGRNEIYDTLLEEIFRALRSWEDWEALLKKYEIDAAFLRRGQVQAVLYPPSAPGSSPRRDLRAFSAAYFQASRWALVYWDDQALVFVRRDDPAAKPLLRREYRLVNPDDVLHLESRVRRGEVDRREVLKELDRRLDEDPACLTAQRLRAVFSHIQPGTGSR